MNYFSWEPSTVKETYELQVGHGCFISVICDPKYYSGFEDLKNLKSTFHTLDKLRGIYIYIFFN